MVSIPRDRARFILKKKKRDMPKSLKRQKEKFGCDSPGVLEGTVKREVLLVCSLSLLI